MVESGHCDVIMTDVISNFKIYLDRVICFEINIKILNSLPTKSFQASYGRTSCELLRFVLNKLFSLTITPHFFCFEVGKQ